jgi:hypothetical protein
MKILAVSNMPGGEMAFNSYMEFSFRHPAAPVEQDEGEKA